MDFSRAAGRALLEARRVARASDARLYVLHVIDVPGIDEVARLTGQPERHLRELIGNERRRKLEEVVREAEDETGEPPTDQIVAWGHPFEEILRKAADLDAELIVLGTAGRSADLERALFGSTAEKVLRAAPCAVLCVPVE
jgi:nucleotide-binding universal stress UspA family protein